MKRNRASLVSPNDPSRKKTNKIKKNKSKKNNQLFLNTIQVPLNNRFDTLSDDEDISDKNESKKNEKIAPVVVTDINKDIHKLITDLKVNCEIKITSVGKKLFVKSPDDKIKITEALDKSKINYFSHPNNENKSFKLILCGLPAIETSNIIDSLTTSHNITPTKVVMFNTKASTKLYLCHFEKSVEVNVKSVMSIKTVYHHIVSWQKYKPKNKGPTQCFQCAMYGHGISSCKRFAVCMLCSGNHLTKVCSVINKDAENPIYKCFNCVSAKLKHDHKANDLNCPFRAKYIATIEKARDKTKQISTTKKNAENTRNSNGMFVRAPMPSTLTKSFAETLTQASTSIKPNRRNTVLPDTNKSEQHTSNELWSFSEVAQIMLNSINELKQCKSKYDQLIVIAKLLQNACE